MSTQNNKMTMSNVIHVDLSGGINKQNCQYRSNKNLCQPHKKRQKIAE